MRWTLDRAFHPIKSWISMFTPFGNTIRRRHFDHNCLVFLQDPVDKYIDEQLGQLNLINFD